MAYFGPLTAEISLPVWGTRTIVSRLGFITAATSLTVGQPNFAQSLAVSWAGALNIHFWRLLLPDGIFLRAKFPFRPSIAFAYRSIGSVTARHSSSGPQPNFAMWYKEWNYGTFTEVATYIRLGGHHVGHRRTLF